MKIKTTCLALLAAMASCGAQAADNVGRGYALVTLGQSKADLGDDEDYYNQQAAFYNSFAGVTANADVEDTSVAWSVGGGYRFHRNVAVEGYYRNFGTPEAGVDSTNGFAHINEKSEYEASGLGVGVIGLLPVNDMFSLYARVDLVNIKTEVEYTMDSSFTGVSGVSGEDTALKLGYGVGAQFDMGNNLAVRADFQHVEAETELGGTKYTADVDSLNVGLLVTF